MLKNKKYFVINDHLESQMAEKIMIFPKKSDLISRQKEHHHFA
jgi:hypothetical protein